MATLKLVKWSQIIDNIIVLVIQNVNGILKNIPKITVIIITILWKQLY